MIQLPTSTAKNGFFIAAFSAFGHYEGVIWREYQSLSQKWLGLCRDLLSHFGEVFDYRWSGNLSHIRTKFTAESGAALCTIFVHDQTVSSIMLLSGENVQVEENVMRLFIQSLHTPLLNTAAGRADDSFSEIQSISDRPLMVVVPFANREVADQDHEIVRELGWHMAAAFLQDRR